jgi:protease YdgD
MFSRPRASSSSSLKILARASAAWIALVGAAHADEGREQVHLAGFPWTAIGKIHVEGTGPKRDCTGILIAADRVLTAGHCLASRRIGGKIPFSAVGFRAGLDGGKSASAAAARCVIRFKPRGDRVQQGLAVFHRDAAIVVLAEPLEGPPLGFAEDGQIVADAAVSHAGYGLDHPDTLSLHRNCRILWNDGSIAASNCVTAGGQSGGPVLVDVDGKPRLAGMMVAKRSSDESYFIPAGALKKLGLEAPCPP